mgnify:CR=1 FL=1
MTRFQKRSGLVVEAQQFDGVTVTHGMAVLGEVQHPMRDEPTPVGVGDWVVRDPDGVFTVLTDEAFPLTYAPVTAT